MNIEKQIKQMNSAVMTAILKLFIDKVGVEAMGNDTGAYVSFVLLGPDKKEALNVVIKAGVVSKKMKEMFVFLSSVEKPRRLLRNSNKGHITSYESRNPDATVEITPDRTEKWGEWGGAVFASNLLILSCSGFSQIIDEAFACFIALRFKLMTKKQFELIKKRRPDNPYLNLI